MKNFDSMKDIQYPFRYCYTKMQTREIVFVQKIDGNEAKVIYLSSPHLICPMGKDRIDLSENELNEVDYTPYIQNLLFMNKKTQLDLSLSLAYQEKIREFFAESEKAEFKAMEELEYRIMNLPA